MPTFPRGFSSRTVWVHNQTELGRFKTVQTSGGRVHFHTAADSITLRGIPAIGYGVAGHIPGTRPDTRQEFT